MVPPPSVALHEGTTRTILSIFDKNADSVHPRFSELKKAIWTDSMTQSWAQVLDALKEKAKQIESLGSKVRDLVEHPLVCARAALLQAIPRVHYDELRKGLSDERIAEIKEAGVVVVRGAISKEVSHMTCISGGVYINFCAQEALGWKQSIKGYIAENRDRVIGQFIVLASQITMIAHSCLKVSLPSGQPSTKCSTQRHKSSRELTPGWPIPRRRSFRCGTRPTPMRRYPLFSQSPTSVG